MRISDVSYPGAVCEFTTYQWKCVHLATLQFSIIIIKNSYIFKERTEKKKKKAEKKWR